MFRLAELGDFRVGDEVFLPGCNVHLEGASLFERKDMNPKTAHPWKHNQPLLDRVEMEGYDGSQGEWKSIPRIVQYLPVVGELRQAMA